MPLEQALAEELIEQHPAQAAAVLERLGVALIPPLLERAGAERGGALLRRLSPATAREALAALPASTAGSMLETVPAPTAANVLRAFERERRDAILDEMGGEQARGIAALLDHPPGSAGALMDALVLALPQDTPAGEALARVREYARHVRYNVYVVDREGCLVGVVNLRELLIAAPEAPLSDLMVREPYRIEASADRTAVLAHAGWREVHSLPVVDGAGMYLGAIRYRTLRRLEGELRARREQDDDAAAALGALFAAGASGLVDAIAGPAWVPGGDRDERR